MLKVDFYMKKTVIRKKIHKLVGYNIEQSKFGVKNGNNKQTKIADHVVTKTMINRVLVVIFMHTVRSTHLNYLRP